MDPPRYVCPTCGASESANNGPFESERAVNIHHKIAHGESLVEESSTCELCDTEYTYRPSIRDNPKFCSRDCQLQHARDSRNRLYKFCVWCRDLYHPEKGKKQKFCGRECYALARSWWMATSGLNHGPNNPMWVDSWTAKPWRGENWDDVREHVLKRDDYKCQLCYRDEELVERLSVHHKKPFREFDNVENANKMENLVTLCLQCHGKIENGPWPCPEVV